jgi:hypothetical protein
MRPHKDLAPLIKAARKAGAEINTTNGGHIRIVLNGDIFITPASPGTPVRSQRHLRTWLKRRGVPVR